MTASLSRFLLLLALIPALGACASQGRTTLERRHQRDMSRCSSRASWATSHGGDSLSPRLGDDDLARLAGVPSHIRRVAHAARAEYLLAEALKAEHDSRVELRVAIQDRLLTLTTELAATRAEVDCRGDQYESLRERFSILEDEYEGTLTAVSTAIGAVFGIAAGVWEIADEDAHLGPAWLGIGGGAISGALGIAALIPRNVQITAQHGTSLLIPIVSGQDPDRLFPTFVWRLLDAPHPEDGRTTREHIVARWEQVIQDHTSTEQIDAMRLLQYGTGGEYDANALEIRQQLYDILENEIDAMYRELEALGRYLRRIIDQDPP